MNRILDLQKLVPGGGEVGAEEEAASTMSYLFCSTFSVNCDAPQTQDAACQQTQDAACQPTITC
jgi:hypothetical protein